MAQVAAFSQLELFVRRSGRSVDVMVDPLSAWISNVDQEGFHLAGWGKRDPEIRVHARTFEEAWEMFCKAWPDAA